MANNLHISYDLYSPGQDYDRVADAIKSLGSWAKVHQSFWYVSSNLTASEACSRIWSAMDSNDSVYVVDASNNSAAWRNLPNDNGEFVKRNWNS